MTLVFAFRVIVLENRPIADLSATSNLYVLTGHESTVWTVSTDVSDNFTRNI